MTPHSSLEGYKSPFEAKNQRLPVVDNIRTFGSVCYYKDNSQKVKLDPRGHKAILVGYGQEAHLYKVYDLKKKKSLWSRDVKIFEGEFLIPQTSPQPKDLFSYSDQVVDNSVSIRPSPETQETSKQKATSVQSELVKDPPRLRGNSLVQRLGLKSSANMASSDQNKTTPRRQEVIEIDLPIRSLLGISANSRGSMK